MEGSSLKAGKVVGRWSFLSLLLGIVGGSACGAAILAFGALIGRNIALVWLGLLYGALLGAFVGPIAYALVVYEIGFQRVLWPAFVGTLAGGFAGAIVGPPLAVVTGILGFFVGVFWARSKTRPHQIVGR